MEGFEWEFPFDTPYFPNVFARQIVSTYTKKNNKGVYFQNNDGIISFSFLLFRQTFLKGFEITILLIHS